MVLLTSFSIQAQLYPVAYLAGQNAAGSFILGGAKINLALRGSEFNSNIPVYVRPWTPGSPVGIDDLRKAGIIK